MGSRVELRQVSVDGRPARVHVGGEGSPLLLIHGGWGGAALHWSSVWDRLAHRFRVIAPELPGIGKSEQRAFSRIKEYAGWLEALLDALQVRKAWCVGNSFGGTVAWRFAAQHPKRCEGLIVVNGLPMPKTPPPLAWAGRQPLLRRVFRSAYRKQAFSPDSVTKAFTDIQRVPSELVELMKQKSPPQVDALVELMIQGDGGPDPAVPLLFLWGEEDKLTGTSPSAAKRLHSDFPQSKLILLRRAAHLPQIERPELFVDALESFVGSRV